MSFDVNIVKIETKTYKVMNKESCDPLTLLRVQLARWAKKPTSSKNIEIKDIERNKTKIFKGLIPPLFVKAFHHSLKVRQVNKTINEPNKAMIQ